MRSAITAARAMYPESSRIPRKRKRIRICGRKITTEPTPAGALPAQLRRTLEEHTLALDPATPCHLKLYNASNFFERRAVPPSDDEALLELALPFDRVVVESHPKLLGERCRHWAEALGPGRLQVAMGLETIHPEAQPRLGKGASLADFEAAAQFLANHGVSWRAFVLVGTPYVPNAETVDWAVRTTAFALEHGAEHIAVIPVRPGNGALEQLAASGDFEPPTLDQLEQALDQGQDLARRFGAGASGNTSGNVSASVSEPAVVTADTWDLETFAPCPECRAERIARLERLNLEGRPEAPIVCDHCGAGTR